MYRFLINKFLIIALYPQSDKYDKEADISVLLNIFRIMIFKAKLNISKQNKFSKIIQK